MLWLCVFCIIVLNAGYATQPCLLPALFTPACVSAAACVHAIWHAHDVCLFTSLPADFVGRVRAGISTSDAN